MSELIDRQALLDAIEKDVYASDSVKSFVRCVAKRLPTIDAVPVRHGEWMEMEVIQDERDARIPEWQQARCSACGKWHTTPYMYCFDDFSYCPNCGALMGERREA